MSINKREDSDPVSTCNSGLNTDVIVLRCKSQAGSRIDMQARQKKLSSPVPVITRQALLPTEKNILPASQSCRWCLLPAPIRR